MSTLNATIANLLTAPRVDPELTAFPALVKAMQWDIGQTITRASGRYGEGAKASAYAFGQFLELRHSAVMVAHSNIGSKNIYTYAARIAGVAIALQLIEIDVGDDTLPLGNAIIASSDPKASTHQLTTLINNWKEY